MYRQITTAYATYAVTHLHSLRNMIMHIRAGLQTVMMQICPRLSYPTRKCDLKNPCIRRKATATHKRLEVPWECLHQTTFKIQPVPRIQGYRGPQRYHLCKAESLSMPFRAFLDTMTKWSGAALFIFQLWPGASDTPVDRGK